MRKNPLFSTMAATLSVLVALGLPAGMAGQSNSSSAMQMQAAPAQTGQAPAKQGPAAPLIIPAGPNYAKDIPWFPRAITAYQPQQVPEPVMANSPKLEQLIRQGQLQLSLQDAIQLAIENNLDIAVQRYIAWVADTNVLRTLAGPPGLSFDPTVSSTLSWTQTSIPVNNPFLAGVGTGTSIAGIINKAGVANFSFSKGFETGTLFTLGFNNARQSTTSPRDLYNPYIQSNLSIGFQQQLLNGFGFLPNTQFILEAKNNSKAARETLANQVITVVANVENAYWNLVYARENVAVQQSAVDWAQKNLEDTQKQLQIGTLAQLDVVTAESELATDQQNLIVAQTTEQQQQTILMNLITRNPMAAGLENTQVVPTASINTPPQVNIIPYRDAVAEAWRDRPDLLAQELAFDNANIAVKGTRNALLPKLTLSGNYSTEGLKGNVIQTTNGQTTIIPFGLLDSWNTLIHSNFPTYSASLTLNIPLRNRAAQAASAQAQLQQRESLLQLQSLKNSIAEAVRNAQIAMQQGLARVQAAVKATQLAQESLDAEQKKFQYGTSTDYNVILQERDLAAAQGNEIEAKVGLFQAVVAFNQAIGRTLRVHNISIADVNSGHVVQPPHIPGTPISNSTKDGSHPGNK